MVALQAIPLSHEGSALDQISVLSHVNNPQITVNSRHLKLGLLLIPPRTHSQTHFSQKS